MLVHKGTMGVLDYIWTGLLVKAGSRAHIRMLPATLQLLPELDPAEWWEVPAGSPLAYRCRALYPLMVPILGESGQLIDVRPLPSIADIQAADKPEEKPRRRARPTGLMPFLRR